MTTFYPIFVIPAKAGIQLIQAVLDSCFRRSDGFSDFLRDHQYSNLPTFHRAPLQEWL